MSLILNIDTSSETASVCVADNSMVMSVLKNENQKDHAGFIHTAIRELLSRLGVSLYQLNAIAVAAGPGSYTGLRVGMSTAKGLCYALKKPLLCIGSLEILAYASIATYGNTDEASWYCPLIDARRMEVFTATFDAQMNLVTHPAPMILDESSFSEELRSRKMYFVGSGAPKFKAVLKNEHAVFLSNPDTTAAMAALSGQAFLRGTCSDLAKVEPFYIKEFQSSPDLHNKK